MTDPVADPVPDLRRLRQFVTTVRAPSMTVAAAELFITQQALSSALRTLERELGVTLFDRSQRSLRLTAAGDELYAAAPALLAAATRIGRNTRLAAGPDVPPFVVAHTPAISGAEAFDLVRPLVEAFPAVSVTVRPSYPGDLTRALLDGDVDLALRRGVATPPELATAILAYHPLRVAVAADHPLADTGTVRIGDLAGHRLVVWAPEHRSFYTDSLLSHCRRAGFEPEVIVDRVQGTPPTTAPLVHTDAFAFVTDDPGDAHHGQVRVLSIEQPPMTPVQALWAPHTTDARREPLLAAAAGRA